MNDVFHKRIVVIRFSLVWIGVGDDALDDVGTLAQFAGAFVEMFAAGRTAIEHLRRRDVVDRAAKVPRRSRCGNK